MIVKEIAIEGVPFNRAEVKSILNDGSVRVELFNVDEAGEEVGSRDKLVSFGGEGLTLPFELTEDELAELNPPVVTEEVA